MISKSELRTKTSQRFRILEGQLGGIENMVYNEKPCLDIITQISALKRALSSLEDLLLENYISIHLAHQLRGSKSDQAAKELLKVYSLKR